jgi:glycosyltransferase involved in cell wall biosynthesis
MLFGVKKDAGDPSKDLKRIQALRGEGDAARDLGNWDIASEKYEAYLAQFADDFDIWVQLGHARKEQGDLKRAKLAYGTAMGLRADDDDVCLHMGHLLKLMGDRAGAEEAYRRSFTINSENRNALQELLSLEADIAVAEAATVLAAGRNIYLDITDLMEYVKDNVSLSGIQRVVAHLITGISAYGEQHRDVRIVPVLPDYDAGRIYSVSRFLVVEMLHELEASAGDRGQVNKVIAAVQRSRAQVMLGAGDVLTIPGAFWIAQNYEMVQRLRSRGIRFVVFVHDLIQLSYPQYVHAGVIRPFQRALVDILQLAAGILTNSHHVADDVRRFMRENLKIDLPVQAVPLGTELADPGADGRAGNDRARQLGERTAEVLAAPYVLSVGTIEVRKNHMYMIRLWEQLIANNVPNIPNLVFVGKTGWDIEAFNRYLDSSDHLGGRLYMLRDISDYELGKLYEHAMFTMYVSFAEGFGLPIAESLAHQKPCIASDRTSMPEVGGKLARYVNPDNVNEGFQLVSALLQNPKQLADWAAEITASFVPKSWSQFVAEYYDAVLRIAQAELPGAVNALVEAGDIVGMGRDELTRRGAARLPVTYLAPYRISGWHPTDDWGGWASERRALLRIRTRLAPDSPVVVYVSLALPIGTELEQGFVKLTIGGVETTIRDLSLKPKWFVAAGRTGAQGDIDVQIFSGGAYPQTDGRVLFAGLSAVAFCLAEDVRVRMGLLEKLTIGPA